MNDAAFDPSANQYPLPEHSTPTAHSEVAPLETGLGMPSSARRSLVLAWLGLSLAVIVGMAMLHQRSVRQEEMLWARQLELSTSQSADAAASLSRSQLQIMEQVAGNVSVQLYMTQLIQSEVSTPNDPFGGGVVPERQYLENLLIATATRGGFQPNVSPDAMVNANVTPPLQSGIALLDAKGQVVAATRAMPPVRERLETFLNDASKVHASASEPVDIGQDRYAIYFQAPIFAVQADAAEPNYIGRVVGVRLLDAKLLQNVLTSKIANVQTALVVPDANHPLLLQKGDGGLVSVPLPKGLRSDGVRSLGERASSVSPVELRALEHPGRVLEGADASGQESFVIAEEVEGTKLQLLQRLDRAKAMEEMRQQLVWLWAAVLTGLIGFGLFLWGMVRHSAALRAAMAAEQYQTLALKLERKTRLLELVTEHTPNTITILDDEGRVCFTNWQAPAGTEISLEDAQGKTLAAMMGADAAKALLMRSEDALRTGQMQVAAELRETEAGRRYFQCLHLPLATIPVDLPFLKADSRGVLIIEEDITPLMLERERQERTLRRIVDCLVDFVDRRDPHAAHHSAQVSQISRAIAETMQQPEFVQETAELAGKLLNVGKMHVPEEILAQAGTLDAEGLRRIREALTSSAEVVEGISFRGPVAETIRQSLERMDGQGPQGKSGDDILLSARIVAVANAFVGMISARAYRAPLSTDAAIGQLMKAAGSAFDPAVVAAMVHYLETQGGRAQLAQLTD